MRPLDPDRLIGRRALVQELRKGLVRHRLVTLCGPGGVGKTTLARAIALPGACWADLTQTDEEGAAAFLLGLLGASDLDRLPETLPPLVLDNAEHVIGGLTPFVAALLERTSVRLLVTSRLALGVPGETVVTVPPLAPGDGAALLVQRIGAVRFGWEPAEEDVPTLAALSERLAHIPLALEIAAAGTATHTLAEILAEAPSVSHRHDGRHRSMRNVVDWSLRFVGDAERDGFERLSLLASPFGADRAEDLGVGRTVLDRLVERSLVQADLAGDSPAYRLLPPIREATLERVENRPEAEELRLAHARCFASLAHRLFADPAGIPSLRAINAFDAAWSDFQAALATLIAQGDPEALQLMRRIAPVYRLRRGRREGVQAAERCLTAFPPASASYGYLLYYACRARVELGDDPSPLIDSLMLADRIGREQGDDNLRARALAGLCEVYVGLGRADEAVACGEEALRAAESTDQQSSLIATTLVLATAERARGDLAVARWLLRQSVRHDEDNPLGAHWLILAKIELDEGRPREAAAIWLRQARGHLALGYGNEVVRSLWGFAAALARLGQAEAAARFEGASRAVAREGGADAPPPWPSVSAALREARAAVGDDYEAWARQGSEARLESLLEKAVVPSVTDDPLEGVAPLASLPTTERARLRPYAREVRVRRRRSLFDPAEPSDGALWLVLEGSVECTSPLGSRPVAPRAFASDGARFVGEPRRHGLVAHPGARLLRFDRLALEASPTLARLALASLSLQADAPGGGNTLATERVFNLLRIHAPADARGWIEVEVPLTHGEMAARLGLARETVARALTTLSHVGRVRKSGKGRYTVNLSA